MRRPLGWCLCLCLLPAVACSQEYFSPAPSGQGTAAVAAAPAPQPAPAPPLAAAAPPVVANAAAWQRAGQLTAAVYGKALDEQTVEEIVNGFVVAASRGDKQAPLSGTREEKAAYYLQLLRAIHDDAYLRNEGQKAADKRIAEVRAKLP